MRMPVREYTVVDAATKLGVNQMTVRRWAKSGKIKARRLGKRWMLDARAVDAAAGPPAAVKRSLEIQKSVAHVLARRRLRDWLPDALGYEDVSNDRSSLIRVAERRWQDGDLEGRQLEHIPIPKDRVSFRPGALLRLENEVLLNAVVLSMAAQIEAALGPEVYSYRVAMSSSKNLLVDQSKAWGRFQEVQRDAPADGWTHVLVTDVAGFYEYIDADVLHMTRWGILGSIPRTPER